MSSYASGQRGYAAPTSTSSRASGKAIQDADDTLLPYDLGHENSGWVEEVGSAVTNVEVGRRGDLPPPHDLRPVPLLPRRRRHAVRGTARSPASPRTAASPNFLRTSARSVIKLDPVLEPKDIAALADAGLTAHHAVRKACRKLYAGTNAVVIGAGGLGHIGIQCLKAMTPTEHNRRGPERGGPGRSRRDRGATRPCRSTEGYADKVIEMTNGGAEVVFDYVGERGAQDEAWTDDQGRRLPLRHRLRRQGRDPHHRHHLHRAQRHRQPGRHLQRPGRADGPGRRRAWSSCTPRPTRSTRSTTRYRISTPATCEDGES